MEKQGNTPTNTGKELLRPVCFMIMPYNTKEVTVDKGKMMVDFNALWDKVLQPLIEEDLDHVAIRADQDLGAMIIKDMIERLALADLVIADITLANSNVYYEVGIRHAAKKTGCVLISADGSVAAFDLNQIRQLRYPLPEGTITDETAAGIRAALKDKISGFSGGSTPFYECLPGFPPGDALKAQSFRDYATQLMAFSAEVKKIRLQSGTERTQAAKQLQSKYSQAATTIPAIALELVYLIRDNNSWQELADFISSLPQFIRDIPVVSEQYSLALSKNKNHLDAIAALETLIAKFGDTSERSGLIGGRYKKLFRETNNPADLSKAIAAYTRGMQLDLNDYYPASNLPRLLRKRGQKGDDKRAQEAATVALLACQRARLLNPSDQWILPTLLGIAFDAGDVEKIEELYNDMLAQGIQPFHLGTTIPDLEEAANLQTDAATKAELNDWIKKIKDLME